MKRHIITILLLSAFLGSILFFANSVAEIRTTVNLQSSGTTAIISDMFDITPPSIYWGTVSLGVPVSRQIVIANTQNFPLTMTMSYGSEIPAGIVKSLTWNCTNYVLPAKASVTANITLTLVDTIPLSNYNFSLAMVVTGTA